ncbi:MAG: hypothetical protein MI807_20995 [Verrucomicrobiales bacterium]|nr:hypothetical protein [Verrucomicrobiales bacterium]
MTNGLLVLLLISTALLLILLRWAHRCWGKAILATIFAPLVAAPLGMVAYLAFTFLLRILNGILDVFGFEMSTNVMHTGAVALTVAGMVGLLFHYCREQRSIANVETGPWLGVRYKVADPKLNRKGRLK